MSPPKGRIRLCPRLCTRDSLWPLLLSPGRPEPAAAGKCWRGLREHRGWREQRLSDAVTSSRLSRPSPVVPSCPEAQLCPLKTLMGTSRPPLDPRFRSLGLFMPLSLSLRCFLKTPAPPPPRDWLTGTYLLPCSLKSISGKPSPGALEGLYPTTGLTLSLLGIVIFPSGLSAPREPLVTPHFCICRSGHRALSVTSS